VENFARKVSARLWKNALSHDVDEYSKIPRSRSRCGRLPKFNKFFLVHGLAAIKLSWRSNQ